LAGTPFFPQREASAPFFDGPSPLLKEKLVPAKFTKRSSRKISQNGAPAKSYSTKNTEPNINRQVPVTYQYRPNCQYTDGVSTTLVKSYEFVPVKNYRSALAYCKTELKSLIFDFDKYF
jgi:hypothetical protein